MPTVNLLTEKDISWVLPPPLPNGHPPLANLLGSTFQIPCIHLWQWSTHSQVPMESHAIKYKL